MAGLGTTGGNWVATVLVEVGTSTATGNQCRFSHKVRNGTSICPSSPTPSQAPERLSNCGDACLAMFVAALFSAAREWSEPRYPSVGVGEEDVEIHRALLLSRKEK